MICKIFKNTSSIEHLWNDEMKATVVQKYEIETLLCVAWKFESQDLSKQKLAAKVNSFFRKNVKMIRSLAHV